MASSREAVLRPRGLKSIAERRTTMDDALGFARLFELPAIGTEVSPVERLFNEFEAHESKEESALEQYKRYVREVTNPATRFILQLIISDEEKHRAVVHAMLATLKGSLLWSKPEGTLEGAADAAATREELRKSTEEFIRLEKEGIQDYRRLAEESKGYYHGLFKLLLDSMIHDSEKHIQLLEYLRASLKES
jgi:rubrerythrin